MTKRILTRSFEKQNESDDEPYSVKALRKANESDDEPYSTKVVRRGNQLILTVTSQTSDDQLDDVDYATRLVNACAQKLTDKKKVSKSKAKKTTKVDNPTKKDTKDRVEENTESLLRRGTKLVSSLLGFKPRPGGG